MQFRLGLSAIALASLGSLAAPSMAATLTAGSNASAISASFVVNGKSGSIAPQAVATGSGPPVYTKTTSVPSLSKSQQVDILTLSGTGMTIKDTATGTAITAGAITSAASSSVGSLTAKIDAPVIGNVLTATATKLVSTAKLTKTTTTGTPAGTVSIGSLSISAPGLGIDKTYTGKPKPNTILYQSADKTVTLYLNRQVTTTAAGKATKIAVSAINLHIVNLQTSGQTISGDLFLASSTAN